MAFSGDLEQLIVSLFKVDGLKFGSFTLKSGLISPVYFDLRVIISHPNILKHVSDLVGKELALRRNNVDLICGVPYTALPIASLVSIEQNIPMLLKRKEQKGYGTGNLIEGTFSEGDRCLIIEDVVTSGGSVVETALSLRSHGLVVNEAIVILDRSQGAEVALEEAGISFKALITMDKMLQVLLKEGLISFQQSSHVTTFLKENQLFDKSLDKIIFEKIIPRLSCPVGIKLVEIMRGKNSNLCLSADLEDFGKVLEAAEMLGSKICMLKTHVDTLGLKGGKAIMEFREKLKSLSIKHKFLIMEDRKFGDIGSTTQQQLISKPFEISKWADLVTVHGIGGPGVFSAIESLKLGDAFGAVLIAEMSSVQNIPALLPGYKEIIYRVGNSHANLVAGYVSQSRPKEDNEAASSQYFLQFTPGVSLEPCPKGDADGLGQQYTSVEEAVAQKGADVIIVGRGILSNGQEQWGEVAEKFRAKGWEGFKQKLFKYFS